MRGRHSCFHVENVVLPCPPTSVVPACRCTHKKGILRLKEAHRSPRDGCLAVTSLTVRIFCSRNTNIFVYFSIQRKECGTRRHQTPPPVSRCQASCQAHGLHASLLEGPGRPIHSGQTEAALKPRGSGWLLHMETRRPGMSAGSPQLAAQRPPTERLSAGPAQRWVSNLQGQVLSGHLTAPNQKTGKYPSGACL